MPKKSISKSNKTKKTPKSTKRQTKTQKPTKKQVKKVLPKKPVIKVKEETELIEDSKRLKIDPKELGIKKLIKKGKKQGYLTLDDVLALFPNAEEDIETLDHVYEGLVEAGMDVFDLQS